MSGIALLLLLQQTPPATVVGGQHAFEDRRIRESSGVIVSRTQRGLLWTMNDSGGDPMLFLTDTAGRALGAYLIPQAKNVDWEALGRGRCGEGECLYIGDTGDNPERRRSVMLYRLPEPAPGMPRKDVTAGAAASLQVEYPDRPHDAEAMYVEPDGAVVLVSKGRSGGILAFRIPASAWRGNGVARAVRLDSLPIPASLRSGRVVTDAAISRDGKRVVLRTYRELWFFTRAADGRLHLDPSRPVCDAAALHRLGEAVDWWDEETLVLTSERGGGRSGTIVLVKCPAR